MAVLLALVMVFVLTCEAVARPEADKHTHLKHTELFDTVRRDVGSVAQTLIKLAVGDHSVTKTGLISELSNIIDVQLHYFFVKLGEDITAFRRMTAHSSRTGLCCHCRHCFRACPSQCGTTCCRGVDCRCRPCAFRHEASFEAVRIPVHSFEDVIKNWAHGSKDELKRVVRSFYATKMAPTELSITYCTVCLYCGNKCEKKCNFIVMNCCCGDGSYCQYIPCVRGNTNLSTAEMSLLDSFIDRIVSNLSEI